MLGAGTMLVDYAGLVVSAPYHKHVRAENAHLKKQLHAVRKHQLGVEKSLERQNNLNTKIKRMMSVENSRHPVLKLVRKGQELLTNPKPSVLLQQNGAKQNEAQQDGALHRPPASVLLNQEQPQKTPPLQKGDLSHLISSNSAALVVRAERSSHRSRLIEQDKREIVSNLSTRKSQIDATPSIKPVKGWYSSSFGYRIHPIHRRFSMHNGLDIAAMPGAPVYAPADGLVTYVGYDPGYGKIVALDHGYGFKTRYGHNSQIYVRFGQQVKRHDVIASVGSTGLSTSSHLHYEVHKDGAPVDPRNYILFDDEDEEI